MALAAFSSNPTVLPYSNLIKTKLQYNHCNLSAAIVERRNTISQKSPPQSLKFTVRNHGINKEGDFSDSDWSGAERVHTEEKEDELSPWEGAVVYRRNPRVSHLEYCTTLERLGLGKLSTNVSRSRASVMGIRVTKDVTDYPEGTPVLLSLDVTLKKQKIRLDGIVRTVITLPCNRCGKPAAKSIFSNLSLLLTEEPIKELERSLDMGTIFGSKNFGTIEELEEEDDESSIDIEDQLYFPQEERSVDISKHIRDLVHLEITFNAICDPQCRGLCLGCGVNLNINTCKCQKQKVEGKGFGPLGDLRKKMQR